MDEAKYDILTDDEEPTGTEIIHLPATDAMVDLQISTAKRYPRSMSRFRKEAESLAVLDAEMAGECLYALPRSGKTIEGPSVRFAEIILHAWGNARADAEVIEEGDTHIIAQGTFFDLERNVAVRKKVKRRITDRHGKRYNDDMIGVTGNAANSIALRNAILAGIPKAVWKGIYSNVRIASITKGKGTLTEKRDAMLTWFGQRGIEPERIFPVLGVDGIEDIKEDELIALRGLLNAIKDGELTLEESFPRPGSLDVGRSAELNKALREKAKAAVPERDKGKPLTQGMFKELKHVVEGRIWHGYADPMTGFTYMLAEMWDMSVSEIDPQTMIKRGELPEIRAKLGQLPERANEPRKRA